MLNKSKEIKWQPLILNPVDQRREISMLANNPYNDTIDQIELQIHDYIRTINPKQKLTDVEVSDLQAELLNGTALANYGVWVYYSWQRKLVHLLPEDKFITLRTNRNCYKITQVEQTELLKKKIGIVGLSVGSTVAMALAMERAFGELRLADYDSLDLSNLNRLQSAVFNIGTPKVFLAARAIYEIDPFLKIKVYPDGINDSNIELFINDGGLLDLLVDECDSFDIKVLLRLEAKRLKIPVIMEASDRGLIDIERFDKEPTRPLLHGRIHSLNPAQLKNLTKEEQIPILTQFTDLETITVRLKASFLEVDQTIKTWPQLASAVMHGGGTVADTARRILLNQTDASGRFNVDLEQLILPNSANKPILFSTPVSDEEESSPVKIECPTMQKTIQWLQQHNGDDNILGQDLSPLLIVDLVKHAIQAPSMANAQPWFWLATKSKVFLIWDQERGKNYLNLNGMADWMAIGAASENLLIAAQAKKLDVHIEFNPFQAEPTIACTFTFSNTKEAGPLSSLKKYIFQRTTSRKKVSKHTVPQETLHKILEPIRSFDRINLAFYQDESFLNPLIDLMVLADQARLMGKESHASLMREMRWTPAESKLQRDGLCFEDMALSEAEKAGFIMASDWEAISHLIKIKQGGALGKVTGKQVLASAGIGIMTLQQPCQEGYFVAGRALQRGWLAATQEKIAFHPINTLPFLMNIYETSKRTQAIDEFQMELLTHINKEYRKLIPKQNNQEEVFLFRFFRDENISVNSIRRNINDVLKFLYKTN